MLYLNNILLHIELNPRINLSKATDYAIRTLLISVHFRTLKLTISRIFKFQLHYIKTLTLFYEGGNFVLHPKVIPTTSIWVKLHKNVVRYVLEIYFPSIFQQNQHYQQVTWPPYDVIMEFAINSMVKLSQNQKCCNFVKNWYIRTKFYQEVYFKDCKTSKIKF